MIRPILGRKECLYEGGILENGPAGTSFAAERLFANQPMATPFQLIWLPLLLLLVSSQSGCVALSIPSERFHDPADGGGLFGHWHGDLGHSCERCEHSPGNWDPSSLDGGPLECDPLDPAAGEHGKPKQDEVPWPKFYPVPTRPVFGPPAVTAF